MFMFCVFQSIYDKLPYEAVQPNYEKQLKAVSAFFYFVQSNIFINGIALYSICLGTQIM